MKATDLMVGDWFKAVDYNSPFRITAIYDDVVQTQADYQSEIDGNWYSEAEIKDLIPIPLTEDILVKNGFGKVNNQYFFGQVEIKELRDCCVITINKEDADIDINIHYVHQLQHLLRLCGIEKEIEL